MVTPIFIDDELDRAREDLVGGDLNNDQIDAFIAMRALAATTAWNRRSAIALLTSGGFAPDAAEVLANAADLVRRPS